MAVSEMRKLCCIAEKSDTKKLIASLQRLACVEVSKSDTASLDIDPAQTAEESARLAADIAEVKRAIEFLMPYDNRKYSLFDAPMVASVEDFDSGLDAIVMDEVRTAGELKEKSAWVHRAISDAEAKIEALDDWKGWDVALPYEKTAHTTTVGGGLPSNADMEALDEKLYLAGAVMQTVSSREKSGKTISVTCHNDDWEEVRRILASFGFTACGVEVSSDDGYADGKLCSVSKELKELKGALEEYEREATVLANKLGDIKSLHDILLTRQARVEARSRTGETQTVSYITGWVPATAEKKVENVLEQFGAAYSFEAPSEDDDVPVALSNNVYAENFEPIVSMYALPLYGKFDPTMLVAVFYTVIFGLMFADVGYGAVLLLGCLAGLKFLHPGEGMKRLMKMFAVCGVSCIVAGVLFGGYFGDLPNALMENFGGVTDTKSPAVWFDMVDEPMMFLVVSIAIGIVHLVTGMIVNFIIIAKSGHLADAVFDVGSWLAVFAGIALYFVIPTAGMILAGIGVLVLICTQGRHEKNIIMKIGKGIMSLYDIVGYASDLLSYTRILALGLASAVIASVVNLLATMAGPTFAGIIMFILIFPIGHVINFLVNILGTYVHTSRLQYIEFFGKFYESGGREFSPLAVQTKYVNLK